MQAGSDCRRAS